MNSGIYKIRNLQNNKIYIGSSNNIKRRWQKHKALLRYGKHPNSHLQSSWNKYGESLFEFSIVELCGVENLLNREQYYIDILSPEYNQTAIAGKIEMTDERKKVLSNATLKAYAEGRLVKTVKAVYQYDLKGNYLNEFPSVTKASQSLHIPISNISSAAKQKCNIAGGFVWRYYKVDKLDVWFNAMGRPLTKEPYRKRDRKIVAVLDSEQVIFNTIEEAVQALKCTKNQLYKALTLGRLLFKKIKVYYV